MNEINKALEALRSSQRQTQSGNFRNAQRFIDEAIECLATIAAADAPPKPDNIKTQWAKWFPTDVLMNPMREVPGKPGAYEVATWPSETSALEPAPISEEEIDRIAALTEKAMEDGLSGFCKTWGWQQFARTLVENLRPYGLRVAAESSPEPPVAGQCGESCERAKLCGACARGLEEAPEKWEGAEQVCAQAYQVVGSMLDDLGQFNTDRATKILDNLSEARVVHDDVLPWPSFSALSESEAPEGTASMTHEAISEALHKGAPLNHGQRAALIKLVSDDKRHQNDYDAGIKDAARYRWLRQFLYIDDVGDEQSVYQLGVRGEDLEIAAGQAKAWGIREYLDENPTPDAAIDAAMSASNQNGVK